MPRFWDGFQLTIAIAAASMIGALIFGIVKQGIIFAGADADWFQVFMGVMLISAVLVNGVFRKKYAHS